MKRNIGIFLGCGPGTIKAHEGIVKLLLSLLHSEEFRKRVVIALPSWSYKEFNHLLRSVKEIEVQDLEFLTWRKRKSSFFILRDLISKLLTKKQKPKKARKHIIKYIEDVVIHLSARNIGLFFLLALPLGCVLCLRPIGSALFYILKKIFISKIWPKAKPWLLLQKKTLNFYIYRIYCAVKTYEFTKLVKLINRRPEIDIWYIPTGFWPETKHIKASKVIAVPDIVFEELPFIFSTNHQQFEISFSQIQETMQIKAHFLCYSHHVKTEHLSKPFQIEEKNISVIRHGCTDLSGYLQKEGLSRKEAAIQILQSYQKDILKDDPYLADFHLPSMKFLFYSSQIRPHKNILNLVKAFEILLRKRFVNVKLVITGNLLADEALKAYIDVQHLQNDVIAFHGVSNEVLAALNHLALFSVNPTLFEGGFPFTFCEAYSVGTPSVMSRIPAVLEESHDETLNSLMLFDPYRVDDMVNQIEWALSHRDELIQLQKPLYERFASHSWAHSAIEYLNLFEVIAKS